MRSKRDPERTREAILGVACKVLAKDGPEGLSVSEVAQLAGVNRGTAYHHFPTREELLAATTAWVSERLCREMFGESGGRDPQAVIANLTSFAMEHPEFGRVWLYSVLSSNQPANDPFWNLFRSHVEEFSRLELAQPGIDCEVHAAQMLVGLFLWPIWARVDSLSAAGRREMAERYSNEVLRSSLFGTMRPDKFPDLAARLSQALGVGGESQSLPDC
jgi:AcrR family transcriptional regulator